MNDSKNVFPVRDFFSNSMKGCFKIFLSLVCVCVYHAILFHGKLSVLQKGSLLGQIHYYFETILTDIHKYNLSTEIVK